MTKIAIYDTYQQMSNPIVVQDEKTGEWVDLTLEDIVKLVKGELEKDYLR